MTVKILAIIAGVGALLGLGAVAAIIWLGRSLTWSTLEDDAPASGELRRSNLPAALSAWFRPRSKMLTYRRDARGRFRRHRR